MNTSFNPVVNLLRNEQLLLTTVLTAIGVYFVTFIVCAGLMIAANYSLIELTAADVKSVVIPAFLITSGFLMFLFLTILYGIKKGDL